MLPPRPLRRLVLAPLVVVIAASLVALSPLLALMTLVFSLLRHARPGRLRPGRHCGHAGPRHFERAPRIREPFARVSEQRAPRQLRRCREVRRAT